MSHCESEKAWRARTRKPGDLLCVMQMGVSSAESGLSDKRSSICVLLCCHAALF